MAELEAAATRFSEVNTHLQYGTWSCRRASLRADWYDQKWRIVMISTIDNVYQHFNRDTADSLIFQGSDISSGWLACGPQVNNECDPNWQVVEAKWHIVTMDSRNYNIHMASFILSLKLQYKLMKMATPVVTGIKDIHWILNFLKQLSWLTLQLLLDAFDYTLNIVDDWIPNRCNMLCTDCGDRFSPVADLYKTGPEFGPLVHSTTITWDTFMLPRISDVWTLRWAKHTLDILIRWYCNKDTIVKRGFVVLCTLTLWWTMVSHIPFKNREPMINIPSMHVTMKLGTFTMSSRAGLFYINQVDGSYEQLRESITKIGSTKATSMGKTKPFGLQWQCTCHICTQSFVANGWMYLAISWLKWSWSLPSSIADMGRPILIMLKMVIL